MTQTVTLTPIDPFAITGGGLQDRLDDDHAADARLLASIKAQGQQVPILVRPHPDLPGHFQIIYGRRRVLALRDLGRPVLAIVRPLEPEQAALANGAENTLRRSLSFIEKANLVRQMLDAGFLRKTIAGALSLDPTELARMHRIARALPPGLLDLIGSAPGVGFRRWRLLADLITETAVPPADLCLMVNMSDLNISSAGRFQAALVYLSTLKSRSVPPRKTHSRLIRSAEGLPFARVKLSSKTMHLTLNRSFAPGFDDWLLTQLPALLQGWSADQSPAQKVN